MLLHLEDRTQCCPRRSCLDTRGSVTARRLRATLLNPCWACLQGEATAPKPRPGSPPSAPPPRTDTVSAVPTALLSRATQAAGHRSPGEGPGLPGRLGGAERPGAETHHRASEPSHGAAILLSRGFPGDQGPSTSHWLTPRGSLTNPTKAGVADCARILLAHGKDELLGILQIPECTAQRGQRSESSPPAGTLQLEPLALRL